MFLFTGLVFMVSANSVEPGNQDLKCLKCHKGSKSLENIVKKYQITTAEELKYLIKKGPKAGLHVNFSDKDLEKAIKYLNLK